MTWDEICKAAAELLCGSLCQEPGPQPSPLACGEQVCGTVWSEAGQRDTDWYEVLPSARDGGRLILSIQTSLPLLVGVVRGAGVPDCELAPVLSPFSVVPLCGVAEISACFDPEIRWIYVAPAGFEDHPCGTLNAYAIQLLCSDDCEVAVCGAAGHDCLVQGEPGCDDIECCLLVCGGDPACCEVAWDRACVDLASEGCPTPCPDSTHDCYTPGLAGCSDPACCAAVCAFDSSCCQTFWDDLCVVNALVLCFAGCAASDHDCFTTGVGGCSDPACCEAVCTELAFCCNFVWDNVCVSLAFQVCEAPLCPLACASGSIPEGEPCGEAVNDGCFLGEPSFEPLQCGSAVCGTAWALGGIRDTDWYEITGGQAGTARLCITTTLPLVVGLIGGVDCATATSLNRNVTAAFCGSATLNFTYDGQRAWIFVAPLHFDGHPCGDGSRYQIDLACGIATSPCCVAAGCACDDLACRACVCVDLPLCCTVCWDSVCAEAASTGGACADECPCGC